MNIDELNEIREVMGQVDSHLRFYQQVKDDLLQRFEEAMELVEMEIENRQKSLDSEEDAYYAYMSDQCDNLYEARRDAA